MRAPQTSHRMAPAAAAALLAATIAAAFGGTTHAQDQQSCKWYVDQWNIKTRVIARLEAKTDRSTPENETLALVREQLAQIRRDGIEHNCFGPEGPTQSAGGTTASAIPFTPSVSGATPCDVKRAAYFQLRDRDLSNTKESLKARRAEQDEASRKLTELLPRITDAGLTAGAEKPPEQLAQERATQRLYDDAKRLYDQKRRDVADLVKTEAEQTAELASRERELRDLGCPPEPQPPADTSSSSTSTAAPAQGPTSKYTIDCYDACHEWCLSPSADINPKNEDHCSRFCGAFRGLTIQSSLQSGYMNVFACQNKCMAEKRPGC